MDKLKLVEQSLINDEIPAFTAGDTVNVHYRVREGEKERIQQYEGVVISERGSGPNKTFTVRKNERRHWCRAYFSFKLSFHSKDRSKKAW